MEAEPHLALLSSADVTQAVEAAYDLEEFVTERTVLNAFADVLRNYPANGIDEDVVLQILEVLKGAFDLVIPKQNWLLRLFAIFLPFRMKNWFSSTPPSRWGISAEPLVFRKL